MTLRNEVREDAINERISLEEISHLIVHDGLQGENASYFRGVGSALDSVRRRYQCHP